MAASPSPRADLIGKTEDGHRVVRCAFDVTQYDQSTPATETAEAVEAKWIQVLPGGPFIEAIDGRLMQVKDAPRVILASRIPLLVDWEHESEMWRGSTEAAGWVEEFAFEPGTSGVFPSPGIWARVEWTPKGKTDVDTKAFRFLSPVLMLDADSRDVLQICSVALTNKPALTMAAVDSFREQFSARFGNLQSGDQAMDAKTVKALCAALGLSDGTDEAKVIETAQTQAGALRVSQELCSTLQTQLGTVNTEVLDLRTKLASADKVAFSAEVASVLDQASRDGKVTPATRPGYEALCAKGREHFENFKTLILPTMPVIGAAAPASTTATPPAGAGAETASFNVDPQVRIALRGKGMTDAEIDTSAKYLANQRAALGQKEG